MLPSAAPHGAIAAAAAATEKPRVLVAGCGRMGQAHALAYRELGCDIAGLVSRGDGSRESLARRLGGDPPLFDEFHAALRETRPDVVSINTYADSHAEYALAALRAGAHVFVEKPLADSPAAAEAVVESARSTGRKLAVGYILRHHPAYIRFVETGRTLGRPLVMRMSLNQQSEGSEWEIHRRLLAGGSPLADAAVHYLDLMCQLTDAPPRSVHAVGANLSGAPSGFRNYGQLQVVFADGSVGWFEAGWGPMFSREAASLRDVSGPEGSLTLSLPPRGGAENGALPALLRHGAGLDSRGRFAQADARVDLDPEPDLAELCRREQAWFLRAIREDLDLGAHQEAALQSLRLASAAEKSLRSGEIVRL